MNITSFIEENMEGPIRLTDLTAIAKVSRFHFARVYLRAVPVDSDGLRGALTDRGEHRSFLCERSFLCPRLRLR